VDIGTDYSPFPVAPGSTRAATLEATARVADEGIELVTLQPVGPDPITWTTQVHDSVGPVVRGL
jgi:hypothetical protein